MKHLKSYNESVRSLMTGKSKEEILKNLEYRDVTFKSTSQSPAPSWLIGNVITTYDTLVELFGKPKLDDPDDIYNHFEWYVKSSNDHSLMIYDRQYEEGYEKLKSIEYKWHIGGRDNKDANDLIAYIYKNKN